MNKILWKISVPPTAIIRGPFFKDLPKRQCEVSFSTEADDGSEKMRSLIFEGVEAFKCTYLTSLGSIGGSSYTEAYGNLVQLESSLWLDEVKRAFGEYHRARMFAEPYQPQHLVICFDDGPFYEFICKGWHYDN